MHLHHRPLSDPSGYDGFVLAVRWLRTSDSPFAIMPPGVGEDGARTPSWMLPGEEGALSAKPGTGQMPLFPESGTLPAWTKVVTGFSLAGLLYGLDHWARPTIRASQATQRGGLWGWLTAALDAIQRFVNHGTNYVGHEVSKGAAHTAHGPAWTIDLQALRWEQLTWHLAYLARTSDLVVERLVHRIIPRQINRQTVPLRARTRRLERGLAIEARDLNALRHWIRSQLFHHVFPRLGRVETATRHTLPNRIRRGEQVQTRTNAKVRQQGHYIGKLLPLLTIAGATALVLKAFSRLGLNFLRCQNVKDFGNELCPSGSGAGRGLGRVWRNLFGRYGRLLEELTALAFVPFALTEACQIVSAIESLAVKAAPEIDALVLSIEGFVCGGPSYLPSAIEPSDLARGSALPSGL